jgi:thioredoxin 1
MAGPLGDIEDDYEGRLYVYKVNVNFDVELAEKYEVMSAPTLVVIVDGEEKNRMTGAAGKDKIKELFEAYV